MVFTSNQVMYTTKFAKEIILDFKISIPTGILHYHIWENFVVK